MSLFKNKIWILIVCALVVVACKEEAKSETPGQLEEAAKQQKIRELRKQGKCPDKNVIIEIDGFELNVPREGAFITLEDESELNDLRYLYQCNIKHISSVVSARWPGFQIVSKKYRVTDTQYDLSRNLIEKNKDKFVTLDNGIQSLESFLYIFPKDIAPTGNKDPVVFKCSPHRGKDSIDFCHVGYVHPNGLLFRYDFNRQKMAEADYLPYDQTQRQKLESFIISSPPKGDSQ